MIGRLLCRIGLHAWPRLPDRIAYGTRRSCTRSRCGVTEELTECELTDRAEWVRVEDDQI